MKLFWLCQGKRKNIHTFLIGLICGVLLSICLSSIVQFVVNGLIFNNFIRGNGGHLKAKHHRFIRLSKYKGNATIHVQTDQAEKRDQPLNIGYWNNMDEDVRLRRTPSTLDKELGMKNKVGINVIVPSPYTTNIANLITATWAQDIKYDGIVKVYSQHPGLLTLDGATVAKLSGEPFDDYTASVLMLYHTLQDLCLERVNFFHFHFIASSNAYVNIKKLSEFLRDINGDESLLIGSSRPTLHTDAYFANDPPNYCDVGSGIVISRGTLQGVCHHISDCIDEFSNTTAVVGLEMARCFYKYLGVTCTSSKQMDDVFVTLHRDEIITDEILTEAASIRPFVSETKMYHIHTRVMQMDINETARVNDACYSVVRDMDKELVREPIMHDDMLSLGRNPLNNKFNHEDIVPWDVIEPSVAVGNRMKYSTLTTKPVTIATMHDIAVVTKNEEIAADVVKSRNNLTDVHFHESYQRLIPGVGYQHIVKLTSDKHIHKVELSSSYGRTTVLNHRVAPESRIVFVLPIVDDDQDFPAFIQMFEQVCLSSDSASNLALLLVIFTRDRGAFEESSSTVITLLNLYKQKYPTLSLSWINSGTSAFSTSHATNLAVLALPLDTLICTTDVRVQMFPDFLHRVRLNVVAGETLYFPIPFQSYDDQMSKQFISSRNGFWRYFDHNIFCGYKQDIMQMLAGDKLTSTEDLYTRCERSGLNALRAPESNLLMKSRMNDCTDPMLNEVERAFCKTEQTHFSSRVVDL